MNQIHAKMIQDVKDYVKSLDTPQNITYQLNKTIIQECFSRSIEIIEQNLKLCGNENWIPVEERKPNNKEKVIVCCEFGVTMAEYTEYNRSNDWYVVARIGTIESEAYAENVTHWMPFPEPPLK